MISSISSVIGALIIPYTPVGPLFKFAPPPPMFYAFLLLFIVTYLFLAEAVKRWFYHRHAFRIEQVLVPKRKTLYLSKGARMVQDTAAVICLRPDSEISFDSLIQDLTLSLSYPIEAERVYQSLQYLRRGGLIEVDWHLRTINRAPAIKEYVIKNVMQNKTWPLAIDDWIKINKAIIEKYGKANPDFQNILAPRTR